MDEIFVDIKDYPNYQISNLGQVYSKKRKLIMKQNVKKNGYCQICLSRDGKKKQFLVHRLVAQAFLENPDNLPQVNHKDENKLNNCVDNLEWCTASYNCSYGSKPLATAEFNRRTKSIPVYQYDLEGNLIAEYPSVNEAGKQNGFSIGDIHSCCTHKPHYNTYKGFVWKYKLERN